MRGRIGRRGTSHCPVPGHGGIRAYGKGPRPCEVNAWIHAERLTRADERRLAERDIEEQLADGTSEPEPEASAQVRNALRSSGPAGSSLQDEWAAASAGESPGHSLEDVVRASWAELISEKTWADDHAQDVEVIGEGEPSPEGYGTVVVKVWDDDTGHGMGEEITVPMQDIDAVHIY
jgi:hypothetical protein